VLEEEAAHEATRFKVMASVMSTSRLNFDDALQVRENMARELQELEARTTRLTEDVLMNRAAKEKAV